MAAPNRDHQLREDDFFVTDLFGDEGDAFNSSINQELSPQSDLGLPKLILGPPDSPNSKVAPSPSTSLPSDSIPRRREFRSQHASSPEPEPGGNFDPSACGDVSNLQSILSNVSGLTNPYFLPQSPVKVLSRLQLENLRFQLQHQNYVLSCQMEQYNALRSITAARLAKYNEKMKSSTEKEIPIHDNFSSIQQSMVSTATIMATLQKLQNLNTLSSMLRPDLYSLPSATPFDYYAYLSTFASPQESPDWSRLTDPGEAYRMALARLAQSQAEAKLWSQPQTPNSPRRRQEPMETETNENMKGEANINETTSSLLTKNRSLLTIKKPQTPLKKGKKIEAFTCDSCGQVLKTRFSLNRHCKIHQGVKPYICSVEGCGKSFPESNTLKRHSRVHTGERPFECTFENCGKAFTDASNWRRHERTHNGEKPYKCQCCTRCFSRGISLKKHMIKFHQVEPTDPAVAQSTKKSPTKDASKGQSKRKFYDLEEVLLKSSPSSLPPNNII